MCTVVSHDTLGTVGREGMPLSVIPLLKNIHYNLTALKVGTYRTYHPHLVKMLVYLLFTIFNSVFYILNYPHYFSSIFF
jgi:hypothetical protein